MTIGDRIKALRGEVSQAELARRTGYTRQQISAVENGRCRNPSETFLAAITKALGQPEGALVGESPSRSRKTPRALRQLLPDVRREFGRRVPVPPPGGRLERIFGEVTWCPEGLALVRELDELPRPREFWTAVREIGRGLTSLEQGAWLRLILPQGHLQEVHPHELHFPFPVVTFPDRPHYAIFLRRKDHLILIHAQLTFLPRLDRVCRVDFLVSVARRGVVAYGCLEADGPTHAGRFAADRKREEEIGLPFLRLQQDEVHTRDLRQRVLVWAEGLLEAACARAAAQGKPQGRRRKTRPGEQSA